MPPTPQATQPFSYAAGNAARYTLAPFRQDKAKHAGRKIPTDKPGKSGDDISLTFNAIMYGQYVILYYIVWGPSVGDPMAMYAPPLRYKREALAVHDKFTRALSGSLEHTQIHTLSSSSSPRFKQYSTQWT